MDKRIELERESLLDLTSLEEERSSWDLMLVIIGGYATRAYTTPEHWRFTKDIDFVISKSNLGTLKSFLKQKGYKIRPTGFGLVGSKKIDDSSIELHISVDKIADISTGKEYLIPPDFFKKAKKTEIKASFEENSYLDTTVLVAAIEDCLVMKLITERERDHFDALSMLFDSYELFNIQRFVRNCNYSKLQKHIKMRAREILVNFKKNLIREQWRMYTGRDS